MRGALAFAATIWGAGVWADEVMTLQWEAGVIPLQPGDILAAEAGEGGVAVQLEPELARDFAKLTELLIGETMAILVCGTEVARPMIRARIDGGRIMVPAESSAETVRVLLGEVPCQGGAHGKAGSTE
ncbi:MAG: hypothetical protein HUJ27_15505 [Rhodobacteraceae bacterium]|nr:hypothetical protein [Paracoccaceae bacterium]